MCVALSVWLVSLFPFTILLFLSRRDPAPSCQLTRLLSSSLALRLLFLHTDLPHPPFLFLLHASDIITRISKMIFVYISPYSSSSFSYRCVQVAPSFFLFWVWRGPAKPIGWWRHRFDHLLIKQVTRVANIISFLGRERNSFTVRRLFFLLFCKINGPALLINSPGCSRQQHTELGVYYKS